MRQYQDERDFFLMQDLIRENYLNCEIQLYPSPADLDYWRYIYDDTPDGVKSAKLWEEDNKVVAFAWMNEEAVDFVCHYQYKTLQNEIIEWSEAERLKSKSKRVVNCLYIFDCNLVGERVAHQNGYIKSETFNYYGRKILDHPVQYEDLPYGYVIKSIETEHEICGRAKLNEIAGNTVSSTKYKYFMNHALNYRQDLDLILVDVNGEVVGFCTAWFDPVCKVGLFEPYGIREDHCKKGLGRRILTEGMNRLYSLGCSVVYVTHAGLDSDEIDSAIALNEAVGFQKVAKNHLWYKIIR